MANVIPNLFQASMANVIPNLFQASIVNFGGTPDDPQNIVLFGYVLTESGTYKVQRRNDAGEWADSGQTFVKKGNNKETRTVDTIDKEGFPRLVKT